MGLNLDNLPSKDFFSIEEIAEQWSSTVDTVNHYIHVQEFLRLGWSVKGFLEKIQAVYIDDNTELINSLASAFSQIIPARASCFEDGVRLRAENIGTKQYARLVKYSTHRSAKRKIWKESDFIYEDTANIQRADASQVIIQGDSSLYPDGITFVSEDYDERLGGNLPSRFQGEYYVTGLDFEGDRFLFVELDNTNEELILRPILRDNFSIISREEKEKFESENGMREDEAERFEREVCNPEEEKPTINIPVSKLSLQEKAILKKIREGGYDPLQLTQNKPGKAGIKAAMWAKLKENNNTFQSKNTFDKAWKRLMKFTDIKYSGR